MFLHLSILVQCSPEIFQGTHTTTAPPPSPTIALDSRRNYIHQIYKQKQKQKQKQQQNPHPMNELNDNTQNRSMHLSISPIPHGTHTLHTLTISPITLNSPKHLSTLSTHALTTTTANKFELTEHAENTLVLS